VNFIRRGHRNLWPRQALPIIADVLLGKSINGPLTKDFFFSNALSNRQPHRYLTSGFIHHGIVHFLVNMITLRNQPSWLALGLGGPLYLTTYLTSIITGNMAHQYYLNSPFDRTLSLGSSGAIGGIYGLMYVQVMRMGNGSAMFRVLKGMTFLFLLGTLIDNVSPASQVGGFLGGALIGLLCAPTYQKSYSMWRKNSVEYDPLSRDYRETAGFGVLPSERGYVPLWLLWTIIGALFATAGSKFHKIPTLILKGFLSPGSLAR
jgi:rhomboid protease GluP